MTFNTNYDRLVERWSRSKSSLWKRRKETLCANRDGGTELHADTKGFAFWKGYRERQAALRLARAQEVTKALDKQFGEGVAEVVFEYDRRRAWFGRDLRKGVKRSDYRHIEKALRKTGIRAAYDARLAMSKYPEVKAAGGLGPPPPWVRIPETFDEFLLQAERGVRTSISARQLFGLIEKGHGTEAARALFRNLTGNRHDGEMLIDRAALSRIKEVLGAHQTFSAFYQQRLGSKALSSEYLSLDMKRSKPTQDCESRDPAPQGSRPDLERRALGLMVWLMLVKEHGEPMAERVFTRALGSDRPDVQMTFEQLDLINAHVQVEKAVQSGDFAADDTAARKDLLALHTRNMELYLSGVTDAQRRSDYEQLAALDRASARQLLEAEAAAGGSPASRPDVLGKLAVAVAGRAQDSAETRGRTQLIHARLMQENMLARDFAKLALDDAGHFSPQRAQRLIKAVEAGEVPGTLIPGTRTLSSHGKHMIRLLKALCDDKGLRKLLDGIDRPAGRGNPARDIIRATLGLAPGSEVTATHAHQAVLSGLLSQLRQGDTGSCFVTCVGINVLNNQPKQMLRDLKQLIETGKIKAGPGEGNWELPINLRTQSEEVKQGIKLDEEGNVVTIYNSDQSRLVELDEAAKIALHEMPAMTAALTAMGVPRYKHAAVVRAAAKDLVGRLTSPAKVLKQIAMGMDAHRVSGAELSAAERVRKLQADYIKADGEIQSAHRQNRAKDEEDARSLQRAFEFLQKTAWDELTSLRGDPDVDPKTQIRPAVPMFATLEVEAMNETLKRGIDAYQATMYNRLYRCWEYTAAGVNEIDMPGSEWSSRSIRAARRGFERYPESWDTLPPMKDCSMIAFFERQLLEWKPQGRSEDPVAGAKFDQRRQGNHNFRKWIPTAAARAGTQSGELTDEALFLMNVTTRITRCFRAKLKARLTTVYEPDRQHLGDRSGFALYDTANAGNPSEWRCIDTPLAYSNLGASLFRDAAQEVLDTSFGDLPERVSESIQAAVEDTIAHVMDPDYERTAKALFNEDASGRPYVPWKRIDGGQTASIRQRYIKQHRVEEIGSMPAADDVGPSVKALALDIACSLIRNRNMLARRERKGGGQIMLLCRKQGHGFNLTPQAESAGKNGARLSDAWKEFDKGRVGKTALAGDLGRSIVSQALADCGRPAQQGGDLDLPEACTVAQIDALAQNRFGLKGRQSRAFRKALYERAQASIWLRDKVIQPGQAFAKQKMTVQAQRDLIKRAHASLRLGGDKTLESRLLESIETEQTPAAFFESLLEVLKADEGYCKWMKKRVSADWPARIAMDLACHLEDAPPHVIVADTNYRDERTAYEGFIHNPFTDALELRYVDAFGRPSDHDTAAPDRLLKWSLTIPQ